MYKDVGGEDLLVFRIRVCGSVRAVGLERFIMAMDIRGDDCVRRKPKQKYRDDSDD